MLRTAALAATFLIAAPSAWAQENQSTGADAQPSPTPQSIPTAQPGQTAESAVGQAGERQVRGRTKGIEPMARITNRVQNRVQNRLRNRIDRNYDPVADAASPFATAEKEAERALRRR